MNPSKDIPTLILLAGFPDHANRWSRLTPHFEDTHHIVALGLPGYQEDELPKSAFWGYTFQEIAAGLAEVIEPHYKAGSTIHLVGHDWGAFVVQLYVKKLSHTISKFIYLILEKSTTKRSTFKR